MHLGLAASTFSSLSADAIITLAEKNELTVLEWNDEHIQPENLEEAKRIRRLTEEKGLQTVSYASSFSVLDEAPEAFSSVLCVAEALGTDTVCLHTEIEETKDDADKAIEALAKHIAPLADMAEDAKIKLCLFCQRDTIFDNYRHAIQLIHAVNRPNVFLNWQPKLTTSLIFNIFELKMLIEYVHHVYIFYSDSDADPGVDGDDADSYASQIVEGKDEWQQYIKVLKEKKDRALLFRGCSESKFNEDCALLKNWLLEICSD